MSSEWQETNIANIVEIISGGTPKTTNAAYWNGNIPWLSVADFNTGYRYVSDTEKTITEQGLAESATRLLEKGDIIISARGTVGVVAQLSRQMAFNQSCYGIRGKAGISDTDYVYYLLKNTVNEMKQISHGAVFDTITRDTFKLLRVNLPPIHEQQKISSILGALDDRITLLRETNATLEAIAQALFKSWFVDFDPVRAKQEGRIPEGMDETTAELFPDSFEESELGWVPRGWTVTKVGDVAEVIKGKSYSSKDLAVTSETALVSLKSFERGGGFRLDGFKPYSGSYKPSQVVVPGDLIIAYTDVTQAAELIGKPAIVVGVAEYQTLVASLDVGIIRPYAEKSNRQFLYGLFRTEAFQTHTFAHTSGTTVLHLAKEGVGSFQFICPPIKLIKAFTEIAEAIAGRVQINIDQLRNLATLRDTLLPRLISGQLRLPETESPLEEMH